MKRRAYRATDVKDLRLENVLKAAPAGNATAGLDIGKFEVRGVVRWNDGGFERPWKAESPSQIELLVGLLRRVADSRPLVVAMESTGTYGDVVRAKLHEAGLVVHRVGGKAAHDYAEVFDGVPSQHDGKDAAVIAELAAFGKSTPWPYRAKEDADAEMAYWADWLDAQQSIQQLWTGRLESLLARHWPEATRLLDLASVTLLSALAHYGGPAKLAGDPAASARLARWGRRGLESAKVEKFLASASQTVGVPQGSQDLRRMQQYAAMALAAYREIRKAREELERLARDNAVLQRQAKIVGKATACVLWVALGDPRNYPCGEAYRKAMGLNLKERSSGKHQGQLKITKRGPSIVRKWMYFAAMRMSRSPLVRPWFEEKKAKDKGRGKGALIAIARKLALALYSVGARGEAFEPQRLLSSEKRLRKAMHAERQRMRALADRRIEASGELGGSAPNPPGFIALGPRIKRKGGGLLRP
jgi:transposase